MLAGTGTTHTRVSPVAAFNFLSDPRHAAEWFASVLVEGLDARSPKAEQSWRFVDVAKHETRHVHCVVYDPPRRFIWETLIPKGRVNLVWEVACESAVEGGTTLRLTTRWKPGLLGWPMVLVAALLRRGALQERSQRTVERARDAVELAYPAPKAPAPKAERPDGRRRKRR
jgi:Polyketide cyclase / dehydrase and lipid transport